jgi:hypothetical protein
MTKTFIVEQVCQVITKLVEIWLCNDFHNNATNFLDFLVEDDVDSVSRIIWLEFGFGAVYFFDFRVTRLSHIDYKIIHKYQLKLS